MPGYRARKRFGQNFLVSEKVTARIVDLISPTKDDVIVEVGPGRGALTLPMAQSGARIIAVEFDRDLVGPLADLLSGYERVTIINQDFLKFDPSEHGIGRFTLIGNLPFNISSPVIEWTTQHVSQIERAVFMLQREVAERLCSSPGSKDWSPLAIFTQLVFETHKRFDVGPEHFRPRPKVTSSIVELVPLSESAREIPPEFERLVRSAFRQRRKQLVNNLVPEILATTDEAREVLKVCGLALNVRAEQLSHEDFFNLTRCISSRSIL